MADPVQRASDAQQSEERAKAETFDRATSDTVVEPRPAVRYAPGTVLCGKYELEQRLGEGGMAFVWRARNRVLQSHVAVKLLRPELKAHELIARFRIEAQVEAQLSHPNIVHVFDFAETEYGDPFIVMELLEGVSLADELSARGRFDAEWAVRALLPVMSALAFAHDAGIVHRDLKPENIFLARGSDGVIRPKIVDFGIAKLLAHDVERKRLTFNGALLGSPAYMAPEQARGSDDVDHRADIWSIAVVLYECLSGSQPFRASNYRAILRAVTEDEPAPLEQVDPRLRQIVMRGMNKLRSARFGSVDAFGAALARWLLARGVTTDLCGNPIAATWGGRQDAKAMHAAKPALDARPMLVDAKPRAKRAGKQAGAIARSVVEPPIEPRKAAVAANDETAWFDVALPVEIPVELPVMWPFVRPRRKVIYGAVLASFVLAAFAAFGTWGIPAEPMAREATLTLTPELQAAVHVVQPEPEVDLAALVTHARPIAEEPRPAAAVIPARPSVVESVKERRAIARPQDLGLKDPYR